MAELSNSSQPALWVSTCLWEQMRSHVAAHAPEEACGLVAGKDGHAQRVIPVENDLHSRFRYRMAPEAQLAAFQEIEAEGLELVAIYHSHPDGPENPSITDIAEAYYPEALYLIWSRTSDEWQCRGFWIRDGHVHETRLSSGEAE